MTAAEGNATLDSSILQHETSDGGREREKRRQLVSPGGGGELGGEGASISGAL